MIRIEQHIRRAGPVRASGFTLLELLVAVGIAALLAVAVAGVFDSVGKTVGSGRRLSELNVYAAMVEQTMRRDFENMSPDGFLVIRNERTNDGQQELAVPLSESDVSPRVRRIDEVLFFSRGKFISKREPLDQDRIASSDMARMYYGQGKRRVDTLAIPPGPGTPVNPADKYRVPYLSDSNVDAGTGNVVSGLGEDPGPAATYRNPNLYASEWTLLRHPTLLCPPSTATQNSTHDVFTVTPNDASRRLDNSDRQIALQPAMSSLFSTLARFEYKPPASTALSATYDVPLWVDGIIVGGNLNPDPSTAFPTSASGVVDIATTDLSEVRTLAAPHYWSDLKPAGNGSIRLLTPKSITRQVLNNLKSNPLMPYQRLPIPPAAFAVPLDLAAYRSATSNFVRPLAHTAHAWMLDAFPASSATYILPQVTIGGSSNVTPLPIGNPARTRLRYEPEPPALLAMLALPEGTPQQQLQKAMALTDQAMLTRFNFLPRCTEFIVEWSLGEVYGSANPSKAGQTIWYGLSRPNGVSNGGIDESATLEGQKASMANQNLSQLPEGAYPPTLTQVPLATNATQAQKDQEAALRVRLAHMIHGGITENRPGRAYTLESFFGQDLPVPDLSGNESQKWVWPKYIRVTMSFVSERDLTAEQTYQVVFSVPTR